MHTVHFLHVAGQLPSWSGLSDIAIESAQRLTPFAVLESCCGFAETIMRASFGSPPEILIWYTSAVTTTQHTPLFHCSLSASVTLAASFDCSSFMRTIDRLTCSSTSLETTIHRLPSPPVILSLCEGGGGKSIIELLGAGDFRGGGNVTHDS